MGKRGSSFLLFVTLAGGKAARRYGYSDPTARTIHVAPVGNENWWL